MDVLVLYSAKYRVAFVGNNEDCPAFDFLANLQKAYHGSRNGMFDLLDEISNNGFQNVSSKQWDVVDKENGISELRKGDLRLFYFRPDDDILIICTTALIKKTNKVSRKDVESATESKRKYFAAKQSGSLNVIEDEE